MAKSKEELVLPVLTINSNTDTSEVTAYLKRIVEILDREKCVKKGKVFRTLPGAMDTRLKALGVKNVADWLLLMQFTGLALYYKKRRDGKPVTFWKVIPNKKKLFAEFTEEPVVRKAVLEVVNRRKQSKKLVGLNNKIKQLEERTAPTATVSDISTGRKVAG